jgi:hypothetical protein
MSEQGHRPLVPRDELEAVIAARRELEPEHEQALVESFLDRIGAALDARIDERLAQARPPKKGTGHRDLAVASVLFGIPITAIAGGEAGLAGIVVAWIGIALVNLASLLGDR